jgi:hypothetical protein
MDNRTFTKLYHEVGESDVWQGLTKYAHLAYFNLLFCYRGKSWFTCPRNKLKCSIAPINFTRGIVELEEFGFIVVRRYPKLSKRANEYKFINEWKRK